MPIELAAIAGTPAGCRCAACSTASGSRSSACRRWWSRSRPSSASAAWPTSSSRIARSAASPTGSTRWARRRSSGRLPFSIMHLRRASRSRAVVLLHFRASGATPTSSATAGPWRASRGSGSRASRWPSSSMSRASSPPSRASSIAAHLGAVRGSTADGFELDIITIVLLGGVSIFGGSGTMLGVILSTLPGAQHPQRPGPREHQPATPRPASSGLLLILSVLLPNLAARRRSERRQQARRRARQRRGPAGPARRPTGWSGRLLSATGSEVVPERGGSVSWTVRR